MSSLQDIAKEIEKDCWGEGPSTARGYDSNAEDIAELISSAYRRTANRDEFIEAMNGYGYLKDETLDNYMLFALCNKVWHGGYHEGLEES